MSDRRVDASPVRAAVADLTRLDVHLQDVIAHLQGMKDHLDREGYGRARW